MTSAICNTAPAATPSSISSTSVFNPADQVNLALRPLTKEIDLSASPLARFQYNPGSIWFENDAEPDDLIGGAFLPKGGELLLIVDPHRKINKDHPNGTFEKNQKLLSLRGRQGGAMIHGAVGKEFLIKMLESAEEQSLNFLLTAPAHTISSLIEEQEELLVEKLKKIVWLAGFARRSDENGQETSYTTHNISENPEAAQKLFDFVNRHDIPLYLLSTDQMQLPRHLNFDIPYKLAQCANPMADFLIEEIGVWNQIAKLSADKRERLFKYAHEAGYSLNEETFLRQSMTPADVIASVFCTAFDQLKIIAHAIGTPTILMENARPGKPKDKEIFLKEDAHSSSIHYVSGFYLPGLLEDFPTGIMLKEMTAFTVETVLNDLINQYCFNNPNKGGSMISPLTSSTPTLSIAPSSSSDSGASAAVATSSSSSSSGSILVPQLPSTLAPDTWMPALEDHRQATLEEVESCAQKILKAGELGAFFDLKELLRSTKIYEYWNRDQFKGDIREAFHTFAQEIQTHLAGNKDLIAASSLNATQKKELELFATQGFGFNTTDFYTFPLIPFEATDIEYGSKIMQFNLRNFQLRPYDKFPGKEETCGALIPGFKKADISMSLEPNQFRVPTRLQEHEELTKTSVESLEVLSDEIGKLHPVSTPQSKTFVRGPLASGKTHFVENVYLPGRQENAIPVPDSLKKRLRGNLAHHEAVTLFNQLPATNHSLIIKTNTRAKWDNPIIVAPSAECTHIVMDITLSPEQHKANVQARKQAGGRDPDPQELAKGYQEAQDTRGPILQTAAKKSAFLEWHLFENRGDLGIVEVVNIKGSTLSLLDAQQLEVIFGYDSQLKDSLTTLFPDQFAPPVALSSQEDNQVVNS